MEGSHMGNFQEFVGRDGQLKMANVEALKGILNTVNGEALMGSTDAVSGKALMGISKTVNGEALMGMTNTVIKVAVSSSPVNCSVWSMWEIK